MKHVIFYIPGLGDGYDTYRKKALRLWPFFGVNAVLLPMSWFQSGTYEQKYRTASRAIADAIPVSDRVTVVGESAGASMAINLFASNTAITNLITIAGVNHTTTPVIDRTLRRSPAFAVSRQHVDESLRKISKDRRRRIHTVRAWSDNMVQGKFSQIEGAHNHRLWSAGHVFTITLCLSLFAGYLIHLAKRD